MDDRGRVGGTLQLSPLGASVRTRHRPPSGRGAGCKRRTRYHSRSDVGIPRVPRIVRVDEAGLAKKSRASGNDPSGPVRAVSENSRLAGTASLAGPCDCLQVIENGRFTGSPAMPSIPGKRESSAKYRFSITFSTGVENGRRESWIGMIGGAETGAGVAFPGAFPGRERAGFQQPRPAGGRGPFLTTLE